MKASLPRDGVRHDDEMMETFQFVVILSGILSLVRVTLAAAGPLPTLELSEQQAASHSLQPFLVLRANVNPALPVEAIAASESASYFVPASRLAPSTRTSVHWARMRVHVASESRGRWLLVVDRLILWGNAVSLYWFDDNHWQHRLIRATTPMSQRPLRDTSAVFPIDIPAGATAEYLLRFELSIKRPYDLANLTYIINADQFYAVKGHKLLFQGAFFGVLLIMIIYNFMLYLSVRDRSYIWFIGSLGAYVIFFLNYSGVGDDLLWSELPAANLYAGALGSSLGAVAGTRFTLHYLSAINVLFRIRLFINTLLILILFEAGRNSWNFYYYGQGPDFRALIILSVIMCMVLLVLAIHKARQGSRPARILLVASLLLILGIIAQFLVISQVLKSNLLTRHSMQLGVILQVALLSLGLADRLRLIRQELAEREKSERLLFTILPAPIANRLKAGESPIADRFPAVTVLFADIVGFTTLSAVLPPEQVVHTLNRLFSRFDALTSERGLEKIKTIGDCYMVVGGLPTPRPDHAEAVADLALALLASLDNPISEDAKSEQPLKVRMRIGIHCGSAVAGVIGTHKPAYDLWGDTVNTASRMESHGEVGKIHCSDAIYEQLKSKFCFDERGDIEVRGKGRMRTYFLRNRRRM